MITNQVEVYLNTHAGKHHIDDVAEALGVTYDQASCALKLLASDGRATRVKKGFYEGAVFCRIKPVTSFLKTQSGRSLNN